MTATSSAERLAEIVTESLGRPTIDRIRGQLQLDDAGPAWGKLPERMLLALFTSRAGSTYAVRLLANTSYFSHIREAFNPSHLTVLRERGGLADDRAAARSAVAKYGTPKAFAAKCGEPGLASAYLTGFLDAGWDRLQLLRIKRRDRLAQAVSLYRAELSGRYHSPQKSRREVRLSDYDREEIAQRLELIEIVDGRLDRFAELSGKDVPTFHYEDICADPAAFTRKTCNFLGLRPPNEPNTDVNVEIVRDELNKAWIDRFRAGG